MANEYLLKFSAISLYFFKNHSLLERGENSYSSGNVGKVVFDANLKIIRGAVKASMKQRSYKNEIFLSDDYQIQRATCECPRGLEICHHIAATLFAAHYDISKTDVSCTWVPKATDTSDVKTIDEIFNLVKPNRVTNRDLDAPELYELYQSLIEIPPVGFRWILRSYFEPDDDDKSNAVVDSIDICHILLSDEFRNAKNKSIFLKEKLKLSLDVINEIMTLTAGQSTNVAWFAVRTNRITASNFGKVLGSINRNRYPPSLFSTLHENKDLSGIKAIDWGVTHEKDALLMLEKVLKKGIKHVEFF